VLAGLTRLIWSLALVTLFKNLGRHNLCHPSLRLLCYNPHTLSRLTLLCAAKRVPHHVLVTKMQRVMDGCAVSRGHCFTHGNPALQTTYLPMVVAASLVHALGAFEHTLLHHPLLSMLVDPLVLSMLSPHILA
jgi:hypothetical protein